ncbi:ester cyclase [Aureibaculum sp. 2210JD6-5]|uniref:ester cyclase n=1 Tax=Aureibaculum sp. 2210JD6-5 TaxID=3103957 RepID=UPI002AAD75BB|nr:ester cyclase [Aureibaculum sp. 2210JD6-5]MDY7395096.1 ester cyclase [Aureibaculum sp. 2210JD6-5]
MRIAIAFQTIILLLLLSCSQPLKKEAIFDTSKIEETISNYLEAQNSIGENKVDTLITESYIRNMNGIEMVSNINEHKASMDIFLTGFPDMTLTFPKRLIKDKHAYIEWTFSGTHTGTFGELTATGKKVNISGITHLYFNENDRIYREDVFYNELDLLQQLGYTLSPPITE